MWCLNDQLIELEKNQTNDNGIDMLTKILSKESLVSVVRLLEWYISPRNREGDNY